ncbi:hypothetical protein, partial [Algibacter sp. PT7-4]|uniref:hypothetical protein n=1 Tax=Algibacter ulvanivorans TaxID=3400999 RepID=UPI003AAA4D99
ALITKEYLEANTSLASGLEAIDEGNGLGWRLVGRNPASYGDIGLDAVDLSKSTYGGSWIFGALGNSSFTAGLNTLAEQTYSIAMGYFSLSQGYSAIAIGNQSQ